MKCSLPSGIGKILLRLDNAKIPWWFRIAKYLVFVLVALVGTLQISAAGVVRLGLHGSALEEIFPGVCNAPYAWTIQCCFIHVDVYEYATGAHPCHN